MILDLLVYNYTIYYSFFFLNYLNFKNIYLIICIGLLIDNILSTYVLVTIILVILYYTLKKIKNDYLKNILYYLIFVLIFSIIFKSDFLFIIKKSIMIQLISIILFKKHILKYGK